MHYTAENSWGYILYHAFCSSLLYMGNLPYESFQHSLLFFLIFIPISFYLFIKEFTNNSKTATFSTIFLFIGGLGGISGIFSLIMIRMNPIYSLSLMNSYLYGILYGSISFYYLVPLYISFILTFSTLLVVKTEISPSQKIVLLVIFQISNILVHFVEGFLLTIFLMVYFRFFDQKEFKKTIGRSSIITFLFTSIFYYGISTINFNLRNNFYLLIFCFLITILSFILFLVNLNLQIKKDSKIIKIVTMTLLFLMISGLFTWIENWNNPYLIKRNQIGLNIVGTAALVYRPLVYGSFGFIGLYYLSKNENNKFDKFLFYFGIYFVVVGRLLNFWNSNFFIFYKENRLVFFSVIILIIFTSKYFTKISKYNKKKNIRLIFSMLVIWTLILNFGIGFSYLSQRAINSESYLESESFSNNQQFISEIDRYLQIYPNSRIFTLDSETENYLNFASGSICKEYLNPELFNIENIKDLYSSIFSSNNYDNGTEYSKNIFVFRKDFSYFQKEMVKSICTLSETIFENELYLVKNSLIFQEITNNQTNKICLPFDSISLVRELSTLNVLNSFYNDFSIQSDLELLTENKQENVILLKDPEDEILNKENLNFIDSKSNEIINLTNKTFTKLETNQKIFKNNQNFQDFEIEISLSFTKALDNLNNYFSFLFEGAEKTQIIQIMVKNDYLNLIVHEFDTHSIQWPGIRLFSNLGDSIDVSLKLQKKNNEISLYVNETKVFGSNDAIEGSLEINSFINSDSFYFQLELLDFIARISPKSLDIDSLFELGDNIRNLTIINSNGYGDIFDLYFSPKNFSISSNSIKIAENDFRFDQEIEFVDFDIENQNVSISNYYQLDGGKIPFVLIIDTGSFNFTYMNLFPLINNMQKIFDKSIFGSLFSFLNIQNKKNLSSNFDFYGFTNELIVSNATIKSDQIFIDTGNSDEITFFDNESENSNYEFIILNNISISLNYCRILKSSNSWLRLEIDSMNVSKDDFQSVFAKKTDAPFEKLTNFTYLFFSNLSYVDITTRNLSIRSNYVEMINSYLEKESSWEKYFLRNIRFNSDADISVIPTSTMIALMLLNYTTLNEYLPETIKDRFNEFKFIDDFIKWNFIFGIMLLVTKIGLVKSKKSR